MEDFFEIDEKKNTVKSINLDDLSVEDLKKYILDLRSEINRVELEIEKKNILKQHAQKYFK
tara:strand:+ start:657 stop:839 length:183 start_codon:yes stop_codon:yes gene_type:complete